MFTWARAVVGDELLDPALRERMFTPQIENYGYGWRIDPGSEWGLPEEVEVISHGGSLSGYRASIVLLDRGRYTIVALGNSGTSRSPAVAQNIARFLYGQELAPVNILGTAVAWRMVRDGREAAAAFFERQREAGFPDYFNNDFAFYAWAEDFAELEPALGLALSELGLRAHPESAMLQLGVAMNQRAAGRAAEARAAAERALELAQADDGTPGFVEEHARELLEELAADAVPPAVGE